MTSTLTQFLEDLSSLTNREDRIEYLLEIGSRFTPVPESIAIRPFADSHRVPACESEAYAWALKNSDNTWKLHFAVENPQGVSAMALGVILDESLSGKTSEEIAKVSESIVSDIFGSSISMGKGEGLRGMLRLVKFLTRE